MRPANLEELEVKGLANSEVSRPAQPEDAAASQAYGLSVRPMSERQLLASYGYETKQQAVEEAKRAAAARKVAQRSWEEDDYLAEGLCYESEVVLQQYRL